MKSRNHLVVSLLFAFALAGCAGEQAVKPSSTSGGEQGNGSAETTPTTGKSGASGAELSAQKRAELLAQHRVHFAFDSSTIDDEARAIIEAHAAYLMANPSISVKLEGNCDERGTREYNLALGERRAKAVEKMMKVLGVAGNRITTVSYGEEKPLCEEHNESCWRQNRRVELDHK
ncbi:MAG: peptidoglycan-associated lipoprotein Pal [Sulfuricaulis sp.]